MRATAILEPPTELTADQLAERTLHRGAVEAVNWGMSVVKLIRFYGPEKPMVDKTWLLPDIEKETRS